ncbi:acyltransferase [Taibaiella sp. KBW10]|uniref:acyltransferase n=1 Tax=Taibaiella sp. KBW10 TaxID=2153357 RepID=UPI000F5A2946|nr:acyltransferase [Taibaiella sp. KBW10]RQO31935.1 acyltransferase [Taibaiella sp. KBW10]
MGLKKILKDRIYLFLDGYYSDLKIRRSEYIKKEFSKVGINFIIEEPLRYLGLKNVTVGDNVSIGKDWRVEAFNKHNDQEFDGRIQIGNNVNIESCFHIGAIGKITIGDNVLMASKVFISDHSHGNVNNPDEFKLAPAKRPLYSKGDIYIGNNVWIGEGVCILSGVTIGENAIIGANSVVTTSIPSNVIAAGVPAKVIKYIDIPQN